MRKAIMYKLAFCAVFLFACKNEGESDSEQKKYDIPPRGEISFTETGGLDLQLDTPPNVVFYIEIHEREELPHLAELYLEAHWSIKKGEDWSHKSFSFVVRDALSTSENALSVDKDYIVNEEDYDGFGLSVDKSDFSDPYSSEEGTIHITFKEGIAEGTFSGNVRRNSDDPLIPISGSYKTDQIDFRCNTLENTQIIDTDTNRGITDGETYSGTYTDIDGIRTYPARPDHPFCKQFL